MPKRVGKQTNKQTKWQTFVLLFAEVVYVWLVCDRYSWLRCFALIPHLLGSRSSRRHAKSPTRQLAYSKSQLADNYGLELVDNKVKLRNS